MGYSRGVYYVGIFSGIISGINNGNIFDFKIALIAFLLAIIVYLVMFFESFSWIAASVLALIFIVGAPMLLFNADLYGTLLRKLAYGGGLPVTVSVASEGDPVEIEGHLVLRTSEAIILYASDSSEIVDIPISKVLLLKHEATPLLETPHALP